MSRRLGPDVVRRILPHRPPFLMVDAIESYAWPRLVASRRVADDDPVLAAHFPGHDLWPGVFTIEGLGQSCTALAVLGRLDEAATRAGEPRGFVVGALADLEDGGSARAARVLGWLSEAPPVGLGARIDVKLVHPVRGGDRLDYEVVHTHAVDGFARFDVQASVGGTVVATGAITGTSLARLR